jgi:hypothetical protein
MSRKSPKVKRDSEASLISVKESMPSLPSRNKLNSPTSTSPPKNFPDVSHFNQCGILWVKFPPGSRGNSWKVWAVKFVGIKSELMLRPESASTCIVLIVHKTDKPDSEVVFKRRLTSQNAIIFRSK